MRMKLLFAYDRGLERGTGVKEVGELVAFSELLNY
jgi:hypothetical protein